MRHNPLSDIFAPFMYWEWDLGYIYSRYYVWFDLVIYCTIFTAVCQAVFGRRFLGWSGKALATALGISLGTALTLYESQFGWNLKMAGGFAGMIMLLLFGLLLLHLLHQLGGMKWNTAALSAYLIMYLLAAGLLPQVLHDAPALVLAAGIAFLICVWKVIARLWPHPKPGKQTDASFVARLDQKREKNEYHQVQKIEGRDLPEVKKENRRIEKSLYGLRSELNQPNPDFNGVSQITAVIAHKTDDTTQTLDRVRIMDRRLRNFDWHELQQLREYCQELGDEDRKKLQQQILLERKKILEEHAIEQLLKSAETRHQELRRQIDIIATYAMAQRKAQALSATETALRMEQLLKADLRQIRKAEQKLRDLTRLKLKDENRIQQAEFKLHG